MQKKVGQWDLACLEEKKVTNVIAKGQKCVNLSKVPQHLQVW